jgi:carnitine 3-dehydrogenase
MITHDATHNLLPKSVAVVGCGLIGASWSALFLTNGFSVKAWDPSAEVRADLAVRVEGICAQLAELKVGQSLSRGTLDIESSIAGAVRDAFWIQENAPESVPVKRALYAEIETAGSPDAIIASSTSSLVWSELAAHLRHPRRFITAHPFNPPHLMPLVELYGKDPAALMLAESFYKTLGRKTVRLKKEAIGHIANRLSSALWREAVNMVAEGIADVAEIDAALVHGPGLRWSVVGAHMAYHLGGGSGGIEHYLKHLGPSQEARWASLGSPSLTPDICAKLIAGVMAEAAGRSIPELEAERDAGLMRVLAARDAPPE